MAKTELTAAEIVSILEASSKNGVSELRFGSLCVVFGRTIESPDHLLTLPVAAMTENKQQIEKEALETEELYTREEQLAHMLVENPLQAEELLIKELEKENDD